MNRDNKSGSCIKLDANNQYRFAMTKPMSTCAIKEKLSWTCKTFDLLLESVSIDDPLGDLFVVDIKFDYGKATEKQLLLNEILRPVIKKHKILVPQERAIYQLFEHFEKTNKGNPKAYRCTQKSHATLFPKKFIPFYLEEITIFSTTLWMVSY